MSGEMWRRSVDDPGELVWDSDLAPARWRSVLGWAGVVASFVLAGTVAYVVAHLLWLAVGKPSTGLSETFIGAVFVVALFVTLYGVGKFWGRVEGWHDMGHVAKREADLFNDRLKEIARERDELLVLLHRCEHALVMGDDGDIDERHTVLNAISKRLDGRS